MVSLTPRAAVESAVSPQQLALPFLLPSSPAAVALFQSSSSAELLLRLLQISFVFSSVALPAMGLDLALPLLALVEVAWPSV